MNALTAVEAVRTVPPVRWRDLLSLALSTAIGVVMTVLLSPIFAVLFVAGLFRRH